MRPVLVFDGNCGFCRRWIVRWKSYTADRVEYAPYQETADRFPHVPLERFKSAVQLIEPDGTVHAAAAAVFRTLAHVPGRRRAWWCYQHLPGFAPASESAYRFVARHRRGLSTVTTLLWGRHLERPTFTLSRALFPRLLGVIYLIAFASLWTQVLGLIGERGILPVRPWLERVHAALGSEAYRLLPTLCWFNAGDAFLEFLCAAGFFLSILLILGIAPIPVLILLWTAYLSLAVAGQTFLGFQWDVLLLEAGFLVVFYAPFRLLPRISNRADAPDVSRILLWCLLFKLMFLSGVTKLSYGDPTWWDLTALDYHYETQCIPAWTSWYVHQLPPWFDKLSVLIMFIIEIGLPFLIFAPRRLRHAAALGLILFQLLIIATGNYGFFNWLTIVLCVPLLDDALLTRFLPKRFRYPPTSAEPPRRMPVRRALLAGLALIYLAVSLPESIEEIRGRGSLPESVDDFLSQWTRPLRTINGYGLFRHMTTSRPEIIIEGSDDGRDWRPYAFKWKPGDLNRPPGFVAPHQPRLDWQMWFAALGDVRRDPWFIQLLVRLLEGEPTVLALIETNPFPDRPPRFIRAQLYDYRFTDPEARRETGAWWTREPLGYYCPPVSLERASTPR